MYHQKNLTFFLYFSGILFLLLICHCGDLPRQAKKEKGNARVQWVNHLEYADQVVKPFQGRILLVNFWATWCVPCIAEMPIFEKIWRDIGEDQFEIVLVSIDLKEVSHRVEKMLKEKRIPFTCYLQTDSDPEVFINAVDTSWGGSIPYTLIYDCNGEIVYRKLGQQKEDDLKEVIRKILEINSPVSKDG